MNIRIAVSTLAIGATAVLLYAADQKPASPTGNQVKRAAAQLAPTAGQKVKGSVAFTKEGGKLHVVGDVVGLEPGSKHGFHIHEFGDCSAPDASTAGDHFAPKAEPHGSPTTPPHHAGDLGNVEADTTGSAHVDVRVSGPTIGADNASILGRSVVLHEKVDDLKTQPSGNSGARIACGVIGAAKDAGSGG